MAELPELEIAKRDLDKEISNRKFKSVHVPGTKRALPAMRSKQQFADLLVGKKINSVSREGSLIHFVLDSDEIMVARLGETGSFRRATSRTPVEPETKVIMTFTKGGQLRLLDSGDEATLRVLTWARYQKLYPDRDELGFDPVDMPMPWTDFALMLRGRTETVRDLLLDPTFVVGIGPMYSDEVLHAARLGHARVASALNTQEVRRLYRAIVETVHNSIKYRGASVGGHLDIFGKAGGFDTYLEVYGRAGERCRNGRGDVLTAVIRGVTHHYCDYQV
ncbi:DNA-formamidopyrimidine glycosylase family protein [Candidatus Poriferisodalis sp.]|uniref:DNA-formamidopyrimidine glycosylase family protein n=1 Tax=Candidatus Poriferisodalis sp. TaxID=3101277 RepID=UPI003B017AEF